MNRIDLIGLEIGDAARLLGGAPFRLEYYTSDKQKIFDRELILNAAETEDGLVLTVGRFLLSVKGEE